MAGMTDRVLGLVLRRGVTRGFLGGSRPWLVIGGIAIGWRVLRRIAGNDPVVVFSERIEPGEALVIAQGRQPR